MPLFIVCCVSLSVLINSQSPYLPWLNQDAVWMVMAFIAVTFLGGGGFKLMPSVIWHDVLASFALLTWYGFWEPQFSKGSPQFAMFPVYFALLASWMLFGFINKSPYFDGPSRQGFKDMQQYLALAPSWLFGALLLISLMFPEHYLSYPLVMTFFIMRSAFQRCIENIERSE